MLEWIVGLAAVAWAYHLTQREKSRPRRRQIHCDIDIVYHDRYVELMVDNAYGVEITASFDWLKVQGLRAEGELPQTVVIPGDQLVSVARLNKVVPNPIISVDWVWVWGSALAQHSPQAVYRLPYKSGKTYRVSQGPGGAFSHTGDSYHAVDFDLPVGTPILAARAGLVVDVEGNFRNSGLNREIGGNYVLIQHDDATVAEYFHLKTDGIRVVMGQEVEAGELLGYSGDTGYSNGPHLHFMVFRAVDGRRRESLPCRFVVEGSRAPISLQTDGTYCAT